MSKTCPRCEETLPALRFAKRRRSRDGLALWCRDCNAAYCREYYQKTKPEFLERCREGYRSRKAANPEHERRKRNEWRLANIEKQRASFLRWHEGNREVWLKRHRAYQARRRKAALRSDQHYTARDIESIFRRQDGRCAYCREGLPDNFHVDHVVPLSRGGGNGPDNLALACPPCNLSKGPKFLSEWGGRHF